MTEPTVIRASSLSTDCMRRTMTRIIRPEIEAAGHPLRHLVNGAASVIGTSLHHGAEYAMSEKIHDGKLPPLSAVTDCARDALQTGFAGGEVMFDQVTNNRGAAVGQVISMARVYYQQVAIAVEPTHIEQRFEADVSDGVVLSGQPDLVCVEATQIDDLKTSARAPGNYNAQIGAYAMLARSHKLDIQFGVIDFIKRVPVGKVQPDPIRISVPLIVAESHARNIIRHIVDDLRVWRDGDERLGLLPGDPAAFLANPNSVLCSERYCGAHSTSFCHEWRKRE